MRSVNSAVGIASSDSGAVDWVLRSTRPPDSFARSANLSEAAATSDTVSTMVPVVTMSRGCCCGSSVVTSDGPLSGGAAGADSLPLLAVDDRDSGRGEAQPPTMRALRITANTTVIARRDDRRLVSMIRSYRTAKLADLDKGTCMPRGDAVSRQVGNRRDHRSQGGDPPMVRPAVPTGCRVANRSR